MKFDFHYIRNHPDLFTFQKSDQRFPHDDIFEKTVLRLIPEWVTPNEVTTVRLIGTPFVVSLMLNDFYIAGIVLFLTLAFTDAIDGSLARTKDKITDFGKLYDPLADKLLIGTMVLILVFENFNPLLGYAVLGLEILFIILALVAKIRFHTVAGANRWGKIKMISQVIAVFVTMMALLMGSPQLLTYASWLFGAAIGFAVLSLFTHGI